MQPTEESDRLPYWSYVFALLLYIVLFILAVLGNSVALWILRTKPDLRTLTHAFLTNLVVADLLLAILSPLEAVATFSAEYIFGDYGCKVQRTSLYFFYAASILTLSAISLERFIAICLPLKYDQFKTRKTRIIVFIWVVSAIIVIPHIYLSEERTLNGDTVCFQFHTTAKTRAPFFWAYTIPCFLLLYLIPLVIVSITYWRSALILSELESRLELNSTVDMAMTVRVRKEVLRMLFIVVVFFILQWTPFQIVEILDSTPGVMDVNPVNPHRVAVNMVAFSNAVVNPVLFGFRSKPFREGFKDAALKITKLICCSSKSRHLCPCCNKLSRDFERRRNRTRNLSSTHSSFFTSFSEIDLDSSLHKSETPVSIVRNELENVPESPNDDTIINRSTSINPEHGAPFPDIEV